MTNSLQAVLDRQKQKNPPQKPVASQESSHLSKRSRKGKRLIGGHFAPDVAKQLRILAAEEGTTVQSLLEEALHDLFVKKGKQVIV